MKTGLAQIRVIPGRPDKNILRMKECVAEARENQCDLVAFPEMCIGGYLLGDRWLDESFCRDLQAYNEEIRNLSDGIAILYGNVWCDDAKTNKDGRVRKFNAAYTWQNKKPLHRTNAAPLPDGVAFKTLLPNYRIFDDERYFFSLAELSLDLGVPLEELLVPFEFHAGGEVHRIGLEICEDLWFNDYAYRGRPFNVSRMLIENGADIIINLSASPWTYGKDRARNNRIRDAKRDAGRFVPFCYVNCVGTQNNGKNFVTFDGDSAVYNENAEVILEADAPYKESFIVYDSSLQLTPNATDPREKTQSQYLAAIEGICYLDELMGNSDFPYIVGLSGGIDSALVACLVAKAVGAERLRLFNLPSRFNSDATKSVAQHVADKLGAPLVSISIEDLVDAHRNALADFSPSEFNMENVQAKIRGSSILSNCAGIMNGVMTSNGNKVEIALGYATLYGDVNGAIAPIGDLLKTEIFALAKFMNEKIFHDDVIPAILLPDEEYAFALPPTAELKTSQIDPMKWGYHDALVRLFTDYRRANPEDILEYYDGGSLAEKLEIPEKLLKLYGLDDPETFIKDLEWVITCMQKAVFKRIQSPPIIIMSKGSYGFDVRESQLPVCYTRKYHELKRKILTSPRKSL